MMSRRNSLRCAAMNANLRDFLWRRRLLLFCVLGQIRHSTVSQAQPRSISQCFFYAYKGWILDLADLGPFSAN